LRNRDVDCGDPRDGGGARASRHGGRDGAACAVTLAAGVLAVRAVRAGRGGARGDPAVTREQLRAVISDTTALISTPFGEAGGEPVDGPIAGAAVGRNRARHPRWWGKDIRGVCLAKSQFSCWWEANANTARVYALADALHRKQDATGPLSLVGQ